MLLLSSCSRSVFTLLEFTLSSQEATFLEDLLDRRLHGVSQPERKMLPSPSAKGPRWSVRYPSYLSLLAVLRYGMMHR